MPQSPPALLWPSSTPPQAIWAEAASCCCARPTVSRTSSTSAREAPLRASSDMYLDHEGKIIPEASTVGYLSVGVPGTVAGLVEAEKRFGKLSLRQVMAPAIQLAEKGYVLSAEEAAMLRNPLLTRFPESRRIFQRNGNFYQAGEVFRQPELARTLTRIEQNPRSFYHGALASELAKAIQKHGGLISKKDLASTK